MRRQTAYAGFWQRFAAVFIDVLILIIPQALFGHLFGVGFVGRMSSADPVQNYLGFEICSQGIGLGIAWLYFALLESSKCQATIGKMALGLVVTDLEGRPIGFGRASGRFFSKLLSSIILGIGYLMVAFTARKQALHDIIAGCLVVRKASQAPFLTPPPSVGGEAGQANHSGQWEAYTKPVVAFLATFGVIIFCGCIGTFCFGWQRCFDDSRFVWMALGGTATAILCLSIVLLCRPEAWWCRALGATSLAVVATLMVAGIGLLSYRRGLESHANPQGHGKALRPNSVGSYPTSFSQPPPPRQPQVETSKDRLTYGAGVVEDPRKLGLGTESASTPNLLLDSSWWLEKATASARKITNANDAASAYIAIAKQLSGMNRSSDAQQVVDLALSRVAEIPTDVLRFHVTKHYIEAARVQMSLGDTQTARRTLAAALFYAPTALSHTGLSPQEDIAVALAELGDITNALRIVHNIEGPADGGSSSYRKAYGCVAVANVVAKNGDLSAARDILMQAFELGAKVIWWNDPYFMANLADGFRRVGHLEHAQGFLDFARGYASDPECFLGGSCSLLLIADVELAMGNRSGAIDSLKKAVSDDAGFAAVVAERFVRLGEADLAREALLVGLREADNPAVSGRKVNRLTAIAAQQTTLGDLSQARETLSEALAHIANTDDDAFSEAYGPMRVAIEQARIGDMADALATARSVWLPGLRRRAFEGIANIQAQHQDLKALEMWFDESQAVEAEDAVNMYLAIAEGLAGRSR